MPTQQEQQQEEALKFKFTFDSGTIARAVKAIAREYPDLRVEHLQYLKNMDRLARNLLTSPEQINSIRNFSPVYGYDFEANIILNDEPYEDFGKIQSQQLEEALTLAIETFARSKDIRRPNFVPKSFDNITGWTAMEVVRVKENTDVVVAEQLGVAVGDLSFNETEEYVLSNKKLFGEEVVQAIRLYRQVILKSLQESVLHGMRQILESVLMVAGSTNYMDIALTLTNNLNINNRQAFDIVVEIENKVDDQAKRAGIDFGAIFPQLRLTT